MPKRKAIITLTVAALVALAALQFYNFRPEFPRGVTVSFRGFTNDAYGKPVGVFVVSNSSSSGIYIADHGYGSEDQKHLPTSISADLDPFIASKWLVPSGEQHVIRFYPPPVNISWNFAITVGRYGGRERLALMAKKTPFARWVPAQYRSIKLIRLQSERIPERPGESTPDAR
jgi:hypothetical protein